MGSVGPEPYLDSSETRKRTAFVMSSGSTHGTSSRCTDLKLSIAYAHIFFGSVSVPVGEGKVLETVSANPMNAQAVNEGDYSASRNVISGQVNYAF